MGKIVKPLAITLVLCAVITGCTTVGPDFVPPSRNVSVSERWSGAGSPHVSSDQGDVTAWWRAFKDPVLDALIQTAYQQNLSLQIAGIRILEARARLAAVTGRFYPQQQQISGGVQDFRLSENATNFDFLSDAFQIYQLGFDVAWELDFWGRYRRGIEAAGADLMGSIADYDTALVSLTAEVARSYILIRTYEERLAFTRDNVIIQERSLDIAQAQFKAGAVSELDVQQAKAVLNDTRALIPYLETGYLQTRNALNILLGTPQGGVVSLLGPAGKIPLVPLNIAVGIPADLLRRRPDIKKAELRAAAQSAKIGVVKADFFPSIALAGTIGLSVFDSSDTDTSAGDLFDSDSLSYRYGLGFKWPILNYGRIKNNVRVQDARFQQLLVNYQDAVNKAAGEVEDALVALLKTREQTRLLTDSVNAYKRAVEVSLIQYREGLVDYQRVLDALRFLSRQQDRLTEASGGVALHLITVYKAMGGGWEIRQSKPFVDQESLQQMQERTNWGGLLKREQIPLNPKLEDYRHLLQVDW